MVPSYDPENSLQTGLDQGLDSQSSRLNLLEQLLLRIARREPEVVSVSPFDPLCGEPPELAAQGGDIPMLHRLGQTKRLEGEDQIVSPQDHFHVGRIGRETVGGDLGHGVGLFELAQQQLLTRPLAVKVPHGRSGEVQVGDERPVVRVALEGEQTLLDFCALQSHGSSYSDEAVFCVPAKRGVTELGRLPAAAELFVSSRHHLCPQRSGHFGDHDVAQPFPVEGFDDLLVVESSIQPHACATGGNRGRQLVEDRLQKSPSLFGGMNVASPQLHCQTQTASSFAGNDRCIGGLTVTALGNVALRYPFLRAVGDKRCGIGIDHRAVKQTQTGKKLRPQFVVSRLQTAQALGIEAPQEGP